MRTLVRRSRVHAGLNLALYSDGSVDVERYPDGGEPTVDTLTSQEWCLAQLAMTPGSDKLSATDAAMLLGSFARSHEAVVPNAHPADEEDENA